MIDAEVTDTRASVAVVTHAFLLFVFCFIICCWRKNSVLLKQESRWELIPNESYHMLQLSRGWPLFLTTSDNTLHLLFMNLTCWISSNASLVINLAGSPSITPLWNWLSLGVMTVFSAFGVWSNDGRLTAKRRRPNDGHQPLAGLLCHTARLCRAFVRWFGWHGGLGLVDPGEWLTRWLRWTNSHDLCKRKGENTICSLYSSMNDSAIHHLGWLVALWIIQMNQFATGFLAKDAPNWLTLCFIMIEL